MPRYNNFCTERNSNPGHSTRNVEEGVKYDEQLLNPGSYNMLGRIADLSASGFTPKEHATSSLTLLLTYVITTNRIKYNNIHMRT